MAQVFNESANTLARASLVVAAVALIAGGGLAVALYRSSYVTQVGIAKDQPIPFSHQRHVAGNGIDCRYCHTSVETGAFAGIPPTETCMTCHSQVLTEANLIQPLHDSWNSGAPVRWTRVSDLPDFTYFDHSIHIAKGVGCTTCHGPVDQMPLTWKAETFHMSWCLQCHRAPEKFVRPKELVFDVKWTPPTDQFAQGARLVEEYGIKKEQLTDCSVCHR
ncbi:MAG TPA: cytochrome c3 family protein [Candidatus Hydrogenedentes bacterium]|nr:cytochrome c3 family protein [Candidatus Hydrogenedentota bacterium]